MTSIGVPMDAIDPLVGLCNGAIASIGVLMDAMDPSWMFLRA